MRRADREIVSRDKIRTIIDNCHCCRLGFNDDGEVYIVPMNFGYTYENDKYTFYFHGAQEGRKVELMQHSPYVGFEMDTNYQLTEADVACAHSARFQSIIGNGNISILHDTEEKRHGLQIIMEHNTGKRDWDFPEKMLKAVGVFKLEVTDMACKEHL